MKVFQSDNFFIGFEHPLTKSNRGHIYFKSVNDSDYACQEFANIWYITKESGWSKIGWALNRAGLAIDMKCPVCDPFDNLDEMLAFLENWLVNFYGELACNKI